MSRHVGSRGEGECVSAVWPLVAALTAPSPAACPPVDVRGCHLRTRGPFNEISTLVTGVGAGTHDTRCVDLASEGAPHQVMSGDLCTASEMGAAPCGEG